MRLGVPELLALLGIGLMVIPVLIALRAKPLGPLPYRWGVYLGVGSLLALLAVPLQLASIAYDNSRTQQLFSLLFGLCSGSAAIGILLRKKWGVPPMLLCDLVLVVWPDGVDPNSAAEPVWVWLMRLFFAVFLAVNVLYFRRRWKYLRPSIAA